MARGNGGGRGGGELHRCLLSSGSDILPVFIRVSINTPAAILEKKTHHKCGSTATLCYPARTKKVTATAKGYNRNLGVKVVMNVERNLRW